MRLRHDHRKARREGAIARLDAQLERGTKPINILGENAREALTDDDRVRINNERAVLQRRIGASYS